MSVIYTKQFSGSLENLSLFMIPSSMKVLKKAIETNIYPLSFTRVIYLIAPQDLANSNMTSSLLVLIDRDKLDKDGYTYKNSKLMPYIYSLNRPINNFSNYLVAIVNLQKELSKYYKWFKDWSVSTSLCPIYDFTVNKNVAVNESLVENIRFDINNNFNKQMLVLLIQQMMIQQQMMQQQMIQQQQQMMLM